MCLSPEVDVVAGAAITAFAVDALRHAANRRTLPLALLPAVFAFHTFTSAFVWWGLDGTLPAVVGDVAAGVFMAIAFVFFPIWVPLSILLLEPHGWRRDMLLATSGAGILSGLIFAQGLLEGRGTAEACTRYIDYQVLGTPSIAGMLYVSATVGAMLLSGQRPLLWWGIANSVAVAVLILLERNALPSLWCFWAACTSAFLAWYLRSLQRRAEAGDGWPWEAPGRAPVQAVRPG